MFIKNVNSVDLITVTHVVSTQLLKNLNVRNVKLDISLRPKTNVLTYVMKDLDEMLLPDGVRNASLINTLNHKLILVSIARTKLTTVLNVKVI